VVVTLPLAEQPVRASRGPPRGGTIVLRS
jgi:hypothetical protein